MIKDISIKEPVLPESATRFSDSYSVHLAGMGFGWQLWAFLTAERMSFSAVKGEELAEQAGWELNP
jgi:hypothetical protein